MSFGGVVGLNYEILLLKGGLFDLYDVQNRKEVFDGIRVIESIVVQEINKKEDQSIPLDTNGIRARYPLVVDAHQLKIHLARRGYRLSI